MPLRTVSLFTPPTALFGIDPEFPLLHISAKASRSTSMAGGDMVSVWPKFTMVCLPDPASSLWGGLANNCVREETVISCRGRHNVGNIYNRRGKMVMEVIMGLLRGAAPDTEGDGNKPCRGTTDGRPSLSPLSLMPLRCWRVELRLDNILRFKVEQSWRPT